VALVVLVIAGLAANALSSLVRGATAEAGLGNPDLLATISRVAIWAFGIVIAVNQLGIGAHSFASGWPILCRRVVRLSAVGCRWSNSSDVWNDRASSSSILELTVALERAGKTP